MNDFEKPFDLMALDENFNLIAMVVYSSLQWNRKCTEPGIFSVELVHNQYTKEWKYIYTPSRRELGVISQVNMSLKNGLFTVTLSGKFLEDELNKMIVYPKPTNEYSLENPHTSIIGGPDWLTPEATRADQAAKAFFDGFKSITYMGYDTDDYAGEHLKENVYTLDIDDGIIDTENGEYERSSHHRNGETLGHKLNMMLKYSHAFYEVNFDYLTNKKTFDIKHGRDLTNENQMGNNPVVFSTQNGTIAEASVVTSNTDTKDALIQYTTYEDETIVLVNNLPNASGRFDKRESLPFLSDYEGDDHAYRIAAMQEASTELSNKRDVLNMTFQVFNGSYEYMVDFDLGDVVSIDIPEMDLSVDAQIIGCFETVQNGVWNLDIEFGTPIKGGKR